MMMKVAILGTTLVAIMLLAMPTQAQDIGELLGLEIRGSVEHGKELPALVFKPKTKLKSLTIVLRRDGARDITLRSGPIRRGKKKALEFEQPAGTHTYQAEVHGIWGRGDEFGFGLEFEATSLPPMKVFLKKKDVDLEKKRMHIRFSRSVDKVWYEVKGDGARVLDSGEFSPKGGSKKNLDISWKSGDATVEKITVKAWDADGFWAGVEVTPFFVSIEHEELVFETGMADILPAEEHKLTGTLDALRAALTKHGKELELQLYIAGYTDTVGMPQANQELSERRARSIASWFKRQRIGVPIFYQGFGESVLAVATPDNTPESRNRRAMYVLSAGPPARVPAVPRGDWKAL